MNREEIIKAVMNLLQQHRSKLRGTIHQEPYKGDFFRLFAAAFNAGMMASPQPPEYLSAEVLSSIILARDPDFANTQLLYDLRTFWQEWTYAWDHSDLRARSA